MQHGVTAYQAAFLHEHANQAFQAGRNVKAFVFAHSVGVLDI